MFTYSPRCRVEDAASLTMPVVRDSYDSLGGVHPIFEMNLPEGALLEKLRVLVIERFDLRSDGVHLGCEDFCVSNGLRAHGRYRGGYEDLARRIGRS